MPTLGQVVQQRMETQVLNQAARNVRNKVDSAQLNHDESALRWVWELIQNAVDSTAQTKAAVSIKIELSDTALTFRHTGGLFRGDDLAALITGGSDS